MDCVKTGFTFIMEGVCYASDMYAHNGELCVIANEQGSATDGDVGLHGGVVWFDEHAPGVGYAHLSYNTEFRGWFKTWNPLVPEAALDAPMLLVFRKL